MNKINFYNTRYLQIRLSMIVLILLVACNEQKTTIKSGQKFKALIITGQSNHYVWPKTTKMIESYLLETGLFDVDIELTDTIWLGIKYNETRPGHLEKYISDFPLDSDDYEISKHPPKTTNFDPNFSDYDVIISNFGEGAAELSDETKNAFEHYITSGGGLVIIHAANNAWGQWDAYNQMIGLGAWGNRTKDIGPFVYYTKDDKLEYNYSDSCVGSHGKEHEYVITNRAPDHPIMKGIPKKWLHGKDELYDHMRGPFKNATILATAFSDPEINKQTWSPIVKGSGQHVPTLLSIDYGEGRIFHTTLGHFDYSMECIGFITTLQRGTEWAASGKVTQKVPLEFPNETEAKYKSWIKEK